MQYIAQFFQTLLTPLRLLFTSPQQLLATPRKMLSMSLAARVAILVALFLVIATVVYWFGAKQAGQNWHEYRATLMVLVVLALVIPVVTYQALTLWLEGETSEFHDIDKAWQAGLSELERAGIEISQFPLFLVIGSPGEFTVRSLFDAAKVSFTIAQFPKGESALHWYVTSKAIYIVASKVGWLSTVATTGEELVERERKRVLAPEGQSPALAGGFDPRRTLGEAIPDAHATMATAAPAAPLSGGAGYQGTMVFEPDDSQLTPRPQMVVQHAAVQFSPGDKQIQTRRLRYLCQLVRRVRQPFCPINGALGLIPYRVVQCGDHEAGLVQMSAREDLNTLAESFRLRFPVVALVTGMESEEGFCELVKRVGEERARQQRFGKGFKVFDEPTPEQLGALCTHACGAFEKFIYDLFKEKGSFTSEEKAPGNRKLFTLLCRIRSDRSDDRQLMNFQQRLDQILAQGFAQDTESNGQANQLYFGGCYFAATGDTPTSQGFVRGVVHDRLTDDRENDGPLYEDLEWSPAMLREDARYRRLAYAGFVFDAVLVAAAVGSYVLVQYWPSG